MRLGTPNATVEPAPDGATSSLTRHVIWGWNGTLFDDLHIVVDSVNAAMRMIGAPDIDAGDYRDHYTRPVGGFYEAVLERPVGNEEVTRIDRAFHDMYRSSLSRAALNPGALAALDHDRDSGSTQSLRSMWYHDELIPLVTRVGVDDYFNLIDGTAGSAIETKHQHLERHVAALTATLPEPPRRDNMLIIGDALDDAKAAAAAGVPCVLFDGGSHHRRALEAAGVPVAGTLLGAVEMGGVGG